MPVYEYACTACGTQLEVRQSFTDDALTTCPECSGRLRKLLSPVGVVFKGSGFYRTDSRSAPSDGSTSSDGSTDAKAGASASAGGKESNGSTPPDSGASVDSAGAKSGDTAGRRNGVPAKETAASGAPASSAGSKKPCG